MGLDGPGLVDHHQRSSNCLEGKALASRGAEGSAGGGITTLQCVEVHLLGVSARQRQDSLTVTRTSRNTLSDTMRDSCLPPHKMALLLEGPPHPGV